MPARVLLLPRWMVALPQIRWAAITGISVSSRQRPGYIGWRLYWLISAQGRLPALHWYQGSYLLGLRDSLQQQISGQDRQTARVNLLSTELLPRDFNCIYTKVMQAQLYGLEQWPWAVAILGLSQPPSSQEILLLGFLDVSNSFPWTAPSCRRAEAHSHIEQSLLWLQAAAFFHPSLLLCCNRTPCHWRRA